MRQPDEHRLLALAKDGDTDAFNRLVALHQDAVYGFAVRLVTDRHVADDIAQETFISAYRYIRTMRGRNVRGWLLKITRNKAYDHFRRTGRRRETSVDDEEQNYADRLRSDTPPVDEGMLNAELRQTIEKCISELMPDQRTVVLLIDIHQRSYEEAASIADVSVGTVKSRLSRARRRIRECLQRFPELLPLSMRKETM